MRGWGSLVRASHTRLNVICFETTTTTSGRYGWLILFQLQIFFSVDATRCQLSQRSRKICIMWFLCCAMVFFCATSVISSRRLRTNGRAICNADDKRTVVPRAFIRKKSPSNLRSFFVFYVWRFKGVTLKFHGHFCSDINDLGSTVTCLQI